MSGKALRVALIVLCGFLGVSAVGGGIALLAKFGAPPVEMLAGSPFRDFTIPGLALLVIVGGGGVLAAVLEARRHRLAPLCATAAGGIVVVFEIVEILAIGSPAGPARAMQAFYLVLGAVLVALGIVQWTLARRDAGGSAS